MMGGLERDCEGWVEMGRMGKKSKGEERRGEEELIRLVRGRVGGRWGSE
jgi:hypothetical protein